MLLFSKVLASLHYPLYSSWFLLFHLLGARQRWMMQKIKYTKYKLFRIFLDMWSERYVFIFSSASGWSTVSKSNSQSALQKHQHCKNKPLFQSHVASLSAYLIVALYYTFSNLLPRSPTCATLAFQCWSSSPPLACYNFTPGAVYTKRSLQFKKKNEHSSRLLKCLV